MKAGTICSSECGSGDLRQPRRHFRGDTDPSRGLPYVVEVEYDGSAILGQPHGMELTPANDVLLHLFPRDLRPRHFAGESAHEPRAVSLHDSTVSKGEVRRVIVLFREIYFEYRSWLGVCHLAPELHTVAGVSLSLTLAFHPFCGRRFWAGGHHTAARCFLRGFRPSAPIRERVLTNRHPGSVIVSVSYLGDFP